MICPDWNKNFVSEQNDLKIIALKLFSLALDVQWLRFPDLDWFHFPRWPQTDVITGRSRALEASTCCLYSSTNQIAASSVSQLAPLYVSNSARGHWSAPVCRGSTGSLIDGLTDWEGDMAAYQHGRLQQQQQLYSASAQRHDSNRKPNSWLVSLQINLQIIVTIVESKKSQTNQKPKDDSFSEKGEGKSAKPHV